MKLALMSALAVSATRDDTKVWGSLQFSTNNCPNLMENQYNLNYFGQKITPENQLEIKSFAWQYPIAGVQLEFYTGDQIYATVKGPSETRFLMKFCGFEGNDDQEDSIKVEISKEMLAKLDGRLFETSESFVTVSPKE